MPARLKLVIAYDGAPFAGWQSQAHGNTIQDHLEKSLSGIARKKIRIHGAGRTDAGAHAFGQCAHADIPDKKLDGGRWMAALNGNLPPQIRVVRCRFVGNKFHARYSAKGKTYRYRIWTGEFLPPFELGRIWHLKSAVKSSLLAAGAQLITGTHDFAGFSANRGRAEASTIRTIRSVRLRKSGHVIALDFDGDGFLYKMVRLLVGALVQCAMGKMSLDALEKRIRLAQRSGPRLTAPADGLILLRVRY